LTLKTCSTNLHSYNLSASYSGGLSSVSHCDINILSFVALYGTVFAVLLKKIFHRNISTLVSVLVLSLYEYFWVTSYVHQMSLFE